VIEDHGRTSTRGTKGIKRSGFGAFLGLRARGKA
jgi:hypothetical protein